MDSRELVIVSGRDSRYYATAKHMRGLDKQNAESDVRQSEKGRLLPVFRAIDRDADPVIHSALAGLGVQYLVIAQF
jgi:hypothetical protein